MNKKKRILGLANMHKEFSETISSDSELSYKYLMDQGLNPDKIVNEGLQKINCYLLAKKAALRRSEVEGLLDKALIRIRKILDENKNKSKEALMKVLLEKSPSFQFRNLEELSDDDIRDILTDVDLLKLLKDID